MGEKLAAIAATVDGMSCGACERKVEAAVQALPGVRTARADSARGRLLVRGEPGRVSADDIRRAVSSAGYGVSGISDPAASVAPGGAMVARFLGVVAIVAAVLLVARLTAGLGFFPAAGDRMGYGLIFVVGLVTSLHCVAMCGGITITQTVSRVSDGSRVAPVLAYNAGRVVSYTLLGGVVGGLGSLFSLSPVLKGLIPVLAGAFMLFLGVRMLGIFPGLSRLRIRIPGLPARASTPAARRGPFLVGLANGLMPCGPLQTMQVYALGTGGVLPGALSMLLFSVGTVPLMFGLGALSSLLSAKLTRTMLKASGALVMALGLAMALRGTRLLGVSLPPLAPIARSSAGGEAPALATVAGGVQTVRTSLESGRYRPLVVQKGIPLRWIITATEDDLNGCNNPLTIPEKGIEKTLVPGDNLIEFTPEREGTITYTCWMGMISSTIRVVADVTAPAPFTRASAGEIL